MYRPVFTTLSTGVPRTATNVAGENESVEQLQHLVRAGDTVLNNVPVAPAPTTTVLPENENAPHDILLTLRQEITDSIAEVRADVLQNLERITEQQAAAELARLEASRWLSTSDIWGRLQELWSSLTIAHSFLGGTLFGVFIAGMFMYYRTGSTFLTGSRPAETTLRAALRAGFFRWMREQANLR